MFNLSPAEKDLLRSKVLKSMSEILSDKHDCKITLQSVPKEEKEERKIG